jgi:hypothetical protein
MAPMAPWLLEADLKEKVGVDFSRGPIWEPYMVEDRNLVTGPIYPAFLVAPPGATSSVTVSFPTSGGQTGFPGCVTPEVHPVVSGTTGQQ